MALSSQSEKILKFIERYPEGIEAEWISRYLDITPSDLRMVYLPELVGSEKVYQKGNKYISRMGRASFGEMYHKEQLTPQEQYEHNRRLYGGPPIHSNDDLIREVERHNRSVSQETIDWNGVDKAISYLKNKIQGELQESQSYSKLNNDVKSWYREYTRYYPLDENTENNLDRAINYLHNLTDAQDDEIKALKDTLGELEELKRNRLYIERYGSGGR